MNTQSNSSSPIRTALRKAATLGLLAALPAMGNAATFYVDTVEEFQDALGSAYGNGRDTRDTIVVTGDIFTNTQFDLQSKVTIIGDTSCFRCARLVRTSTHVNTPLLNVQYPDIEIRNLLLLGSGQNTNTQVAAEAGNDSSNSALINIPATSYGNNHPSGLKVINNTLQNSAIGVGSAGLIPRDLTVTDNDFNDVNRAVELLRDLAVVSDIDNITDAQALDGGKLDVSRNYHRGDRIRLGISVDAGNDGYPYVAHSFPDVRRDVRIKFRDRPTVFDTSSTINLNTVEGANEFGIAIATVRNMNVAGNTIYTTEDDIVSDASIENNFTAGINVEHNSHFINVDNNTIHVGTTGVFSTGINVLPFQDHGAPLDHRNASSLVTLRGNAIKGTGHQAILGFGYNNLQLINNNADDFTTTAADNSTVSLFNVPNGNSTSSASGNVDFFYFYNFNGNGVAPRSFDSTGNIE